VLGTAKEPILERVTIESKHGEIIVVMSRVRKKFMPKIFASCRNNKNVMDYAITQSLNFPHCDTLPGMAENN